jgi:hypothetical protein
MNKTLKILLVVALIAGVSYYFINRKPWTTLKSELKDFSVQDTASVYKVFIADKRGGKVTLNKTENKVWLVNNNIEADANKINLLLSTLKDVQVLRPVAQNEFNSTIAFMSTEGIKKPVGSATPYVKIMPMKKVADITADVWAGNWSTDMVNSRSRPMSRVSNIIEFTMLTRPVEHSERASEL